MGHLYSTIVLEYSMLFSMDNVFFYKKFNLSRLCVIIWRFHMKIVIRSVICIFWGRTRVSAKTVYELPKHGRTQKPVPGTFCLSQIDTPMARILVIFILNIELWLHYGCCCHRFRSITTHFWKGREGCLWTMHLLFKSSSLKCIWFGNIWKFLDSL